MDLWLQSLSGTYLDSGRFLDLTSGHLIRKTEGKCLISYMGWFIKCLKKLLVLVFHPFIFSTIRLKSGFGISIFKTTEQASNIYI